MNGKTIENVRMRTFRYFYEDGLVELAVGLQFALIGLGLWLLESRTEGLAYIVGISLGIMLIILVGNFGVKWIVGKLKARIVHPRTGSVEYREQVDRGKWRLLIAVTAIAFLVLFLPEELTEIEMTIGVILAVIYFYMGFRVSLLRMQLLALVPLSAGVYTFVAQLGNIYGIAFVFGSSGLAMAIMGLLVFWQYLQDHPQPEGE